MKAKKERMAIEIDRLEDNLKLLFTFVYGVATATGNQEINIAIEEYKQNVFINLKEIQRIQKLNK